MNDLDTEFGRPRDVRRHFRRALASGVLLLAACVVPARAAEQGFAARTGLEIASVAARTWSPDAFLIYIENDEDLDASGAAERWGYLFYSPALKKCRVYSVRGDKILVAEQLPVKLEAPPVHPGWIDSGAALEAAERGAGRDYREKHHGRLATMLLMRGAFSDGDPDPTTWTLVYTAPNTPSLFVVVDATAGKVRRTWRG